MTIRHRPSFLAAVTAFVIAALTQPALAMYHPTVGRFLQRDPIGYADGVNLYECSRSSPATVADSSGLATEAAIDKGDLVYSCNCGWIDWSHASAGVVNFWPAIEKERGRRSRLGPGFRVQAQMTHAKEWRGIRVSSGVAKSFYVRLGLSRREKESVALGIFLEIALRFEAFQGEWPYSWFTTSSFSEEDLTSDILGFYRSVRGVTKPEIEKACQAIKDKEVLRTIWRQTGGTATYHPEWVPNHLKPKYHHGDSAMAAACCAKSAKQWPKEYDEVAPAKRGLVRWIYPDVGYRRLQIDPTALYRYWVPGVQWDGRDTEEAVGGYVPLRIE